MHSGPDGAGTRASTTSSFSHFDSTAPSWMLLGLACVGQFMVVLDVSIVTVALPSMQRNLGFSTAQLQWVVNAYALTFGGFLLLGGRAADIFGRKRVFILGLALFCGASLVCAVAQNQQMLVGARALQGLGGAVLSPATLTILTTTFTEPGERTRALGIWSAMAAIGGASGALFGGILTDLLSWRWIFYINLPIGITAILVARFALVESRAQNQRRNLDVLGSITVTASMVSLVYALAGTEQHPWLSSATLVPLALAGVLFCAFVVIERRVAREPLVPFRLFRSRALTIANVTILFLTASMFSMWLLLSLYIQDVLGFSPLLTGLGFIPQTAAIAVAAQISARLVPRVGPRTPLVAGVAMSAAGLFWLSLASPHGSYVSEVLGGSVLATFGMGLAFTPLAFSATAGVARGEAGLASGVLNTSRQVGGAIGLAALATIAATRTRELLGAASTTGRIVGPNYRAFALTAGFTKAFAVGALIVAVGGVVALFLPGRPAVERENGAARLPDRAEHSQPSEHLDPPDSVGLDPASRPAIYESAPPRAKHR
jgi:EmrB/QacA subfamily drug resistance transporter